MTQQEAAGVYLFIGAILGFMGIREHRALSQYGWLIVSVALFAFILLWPISIFGPKRK